MQERFLPFHALDIAEDEIQSVVETLRSGWLTSGAKVRQFEEDFAEYVGCGHAVALNSGTAALHLALEAIGVTEGDEVLVPTMTFAASAEVVLYLKAKPVLIDCRHDTMNIDPDQLEKAITAKTKAIMPVHIGGQACDMDRILEIARERQVKVIEDAAHALPTRYRGRDGGDDGGYHLFFVLCHQDDYDGRRRHGHDRECRVGGPHACDEPAWDQSGCVEALYRGGVLVLRGAGSGL